MKMRMLVVSSFLLLSFAFAQEANEKAQVTVGTTGSTTIEFLEPVPTMKAYANTVAMHNIDGKTKGSRLSLKGTTNRPVVIEVVKEGKLVLRISTSEATLVETPKE